MFISNLKNLMMDLYTVHKDAKMLKPKDGNQINSVSGIFYVK